MSQRAAIRFHPIDEGDAVAEAIEHFLDLRPRLVTIARRILGCQGDAEDVVQDAWIRWQTYDRRSVRNATAFLVTTTTRLAINVAQSARVRREATVGDWPIEPPAAEDQRVATAERGDELGDGIRLLLQRLTPPERAAYLLRQAFDYRYQEIADVLGVTEVNARQLVSRATRHLTAEPRWPVASDDERSLRHAFLAAAHAGELHRLLGLLTAHVTDTVTAAEAVVTDRRPAWSPR